MRGKFSSSDLERNRTRNYSAFIIVSGIFTSQKTGANPQAISALLFPGDREGFPVLPGRSEHPIIIPPE
jgi:hypothetical protein